MTVRRIRPLRELLVRAEALVSRWRHRFAQTALVGLVACGGEPSSPADTPSTIAVDVSIAGNSVDPDGFSVAIADTNLRYTGAGTQQVVGVHRGSYSAKIAGLADNCATDSSTWTIVVPAGAGATLHIAVECYGGFAYTASGGSSGAALYYLGEDGRTSMIATAGLQAVAKDWSSDGRRLIVERDEHDGSFVASIINIDGSSVRALGSSISPRFSPDGSMVAYCTFAIPVGYRLRIADVADTLNRPAVSDSANVQDCFAAWSPDGSQLAFETNRFTVPGPSEFAVMNVDGTNLHPIGGSFSMTGPAPAWSPDGQFIAGVLSPSDLAATRPELGVLPSKGGPLALAWSGDSLVGIATWAPDGAKLAIDVDDFIHATGQSVILLEPDGTGRFVLAPSLAYS